MILHPRHRRGRGPWIAVLVSLAVILGGVSFALTRSATPAGPPRAPGQVHVYSVRGQIEELPDLARPSATLMIQHEEIKDFARKDGTFGMSSMTMSFPTARGVSLDGLAESDKVEFTLELNWSALPIYQITRISKLPADTTLSLVPEAAPGQ